MEKTPYMISHLVHLCNPWAVAQKNAFRCATEFFPVRTGIVSFARPHVPHIPELDIALAFAILDDGTFGGFRRRLAAFRKSKPPLQIQQRRIVGWTRRRIDHFRCHLTEIGLRYQVRDTSKVIDIACEFSAR